MKPMLYQLRLGINRRTD